MSGIQDRSIGWKTCRLYLEAAKAQDVIGTAGADTGQNGGGPLVAVAAGASNLAVVQAAANGDEVSFFIPIPWNLNRDKKVLGRVCFIHSSTDADTPAFTIKTKFHAKQATVVDMDTSDDASVAFSSHTCSTTVESLEATDWTDLEWDTAVTSSDIFVGIILQATTISASANEVEILGLELAWEIDSTDPSGKQETDIMELEQPV